MDKRPWCSFEAFNVITSIDEKLGGVPNNIRENVDLISIVESCRLSAIGFRGHKYIWSNKRDIHHRIFKRLDRALLNED